jgi:hypothetical protein
MAQKSFKTRISYGDEETHQETTTWTPFAKVLEITPPPLNSDNIETTHLESEDEMREWEPGLGDGGESTFKLQWEKAQNATIYGLWRQKKGFQISYADAPQPSGSKLKFNGFIQNIANETITKDNVVEAEIVIKIIGKPDFVPKA